MARSSTTFQKGNKVAVGNRGPARPDFCTQILISLLHEVDKDTGREKVHLMCEKLYQLAIGYKYEAVRNGVLQQVELRPNLAAIREIFDRVQGKAPVAVQQPGPVPQLQFTEEMSEEEAMAVLERYDGIPMPRRLSSDDDTTH